jgi:hypothetical protein
MWYKKCQKVEIWTFLEAACSPAKHYLCPFYFKDGRTLKRKKVLSSEAGLPDWANFSAVGLLFTLCDCLLWAVL